MKIKTIYTDKPNLKFIGRRKSWTLNLPGKEFPAWNLFFFKRDKEPKVIEAVNLTTDKIEDYFGIDH